MGITVKKCHMIMSGNDCWNSVCFSCCRKADNELADVTLSVYWYAEWPMRATVLANGKTYTQSQQARFCL